MGAPIYHPFPGQLTIHRSKSRFRVVCTGRRFGKPSALPER
ncbi:hypothetical protein PDESU_06178 [Pontiella desulfatans]|uniref:Uncharacterized protein n=1 Tax=Pontiella desulfatans TaxID=2750659 RepID=A0A6C2UBW2_PONDE|nr:hypothetical protein PDESU_06178 [Pontiella desulfatans]